MRQRLPNDANNRLVSELYEDGETVTYRFDNSGELAAVIDSATGTTTKYYYDMAGRLMKYWDKSADNSHRMTYTYDAMDNLTRRRQVTNGDVFTTSYSYDDDDRLLKVTNGDTEKTYSYDGSGRLYRQLTKADGTTVLTETMTFHGGSDHPSENVTAFTSGQIKKYTSTYANGALAYTYTYDNKGNILSVSDGTNTTSYVYDTMGQLVRANDQAAGKTWTWRYDAAGNITHHREYAYTTDSLGDALDTVHYLYADSKGWGDLLTSFDGKTITYDTIGNPLNDGTWRYTWEHGRQLAAMEFVTEEEDEKVTWRMTYDANGLRTGRTNGTNTYTYWYDGSGQLVRMQYGTLVLRIAYSLDGRPISISYNGETYYYVLNQQGDVMAIVDNSGNWVVKYTYDPWGNILTTTASNNTMYNTLAQYNPLRYRGYVYDRETGLYYLQSRYYDPEMGRFLNADSSVSSIGGVLLGNNAFSYCFNNPTNMSDYTGNWPEWVSGTMTSIDSEDDTVWYYNNAASAKTELLESILASIPTSGEPNSSQILLNPDGSIKRKRWYGPDGKPIRDRDYNHSGTMPFPHDHEWENGTRGKDHLPPSPEYQFSSNPIIGIGMASVCALGIFAVAVDNLTGIGAANDFLLVPLGTAMTKYISDIFK